MSCYRPLLAVPYKSNHPKYGQYRIEGRAAYIHYLRYATDPNTGEYLEGIRVPCGKCIGCRLDYSRQWATRIQCEALDYPDNSNWFVTLTYAQPGDPDYLGVYPRSGVFNDDGALILQKEHTQDWMKRFRMTHSRHVREVGDGDTGIRFYLAGEYGERTMRPHYHCILMNAELPDLRQIGRNKLGMPLYESKMLTDSWGFGHVTIGKMSFQTAAYCARYTMKKATGGIPAEVLGLTPEFVNMSRRPGIGFRYFDEHFEKIYQDDEIILPAVSKDKPNKQRPPRYFDKLMNEKDPRSLALIKSRRADVAQMLQAHKLGKTDLDEAAYFELQETNALSRSKKLIRDL